MTPGRIGRIPRSGRGRWSGRERFRGNAARPAAVARVRLFLVTGGGAQGLEQHRAGQRRQPETACQGTVFLESPRQAAADPGGRVVGTGALPVRTGESLQLVARHRDRHIRQSLLRRRGRDPGQRAHLHIRQATRRELPPDHRQFSQRAGDPDMLAGRAGGHLAFP
jgi:hypothetical protein